MKRSLLSVSLLLCVACSALAQDKITLKLKYLPGTYVTTMKTSQEQQITGPQKITQTVSMTMVMEMTVDKASDNGQQIHVTYKRVAQAIKGGPVEMAYDSADKKGGDEKNPMAILGNMVDAAIDVTLDADGKVTKVKGMNEIFDKMAKDNPMMGAQMKKSMGDKTVTEMFDGAAGTCPISPSPSATSGNARRRSTRQWAARWTSRRSIRSRKSSPRTGTRSPLSTWPAGPRSRTPAIRNPMTMRPNPSWTFSRPAR